MKFKDQLVPIVGFVLVLITQVVYQIIGENATIGKIVSVGFFSVLIYTLLLTLYTWFYSKPYAIIEGKREEYKEFLTKIEASVNKLIQEQRFIDQRTLDIIEKQVTKNIWVITTKLASEIYNTNLQESVEDNLAKDKYYTYFLPHPENNYFKNVVNRNLRKFKELELYKQHKANIRFIRLPLDTQFLLEEVVIYNPDEEEDRKENTKGLNAFTFYESKDENTDSLHMKIEGDMIINIRDHLDNYLESTALKFAAERLLADTEYSDKIMDEDKLYIANLMNKIVISDLIGYEKFINGLRNKEISQPLASDIDKMLRQYTRRNE